ncbi:MAG: ribbon-helix-helix domain-containing protein [Oscillospiraceae bacterium]|nr:ribbon-helix-helix domain-containing protein [Oscillospiraceae bacterium]
MSPRTGRPTDNPKTISKHFRFSEEDVKLLDECCKATGFSKTEIIRQGIREVYAKIKNNSDTVPY